MCTILQAFSWVFILVAHPETKYERPNSSAPAGTVVDVPTGTKESGSDADVPATTTATPTPQALHHGKPSKAQFSIIPSAKKYNHGIQGVVRDVVSPIQILFYPIVLWAAFAMGFAANALLAVNLTQAQVFGPPPYSFTPDQLGYINFAFVVGAAIALVTAGPFSDWVALRRARKNGGIMEAEFRLPAMIPFVALSLVGLVITAVGYQRSWPWPAIAVGG